MHSAVPCEALLAAARARVCQSVRCPQGSRVKELLAAGVNVCFAQDSIEDPWYPLGNGNMMNILDHGIHICQMMSFAEIDHALDLITTNGARTMHIEDTYVSRPGKTRASSSSTRRCPLRPSASARASCAPCAAVRSSSPASRRRRGASTTCSPEQEGIKEALIK